MHTPRSTAGGLIPWLLNLRVIGGALLVAFLLFCLTLSLLWATRSSDKPASQATAILSIIQAPLTTETALPVSLVPNPTGASSIPPSPQPGAIVVGSYIQITGTSGDGLHLRAEPGLNGKVLLLGSEAEVFQVQDGPREADGYTWWYLVGPFDPKRFGWAVANFLAVVQGP